MLALIQSESLWRDSQVARQRSAKSLYVGSIPTPASNFMKIEWDKVITQAITTLVVAIFLGAATIVWKGATSVDTKVQNTREDLQHLITALSDKLGGYEVQLTSLSNQLETVIINQSNLVSDNSVKNLPIQRTWYKSDNEKLIQQKAYSQDVLKQLNRQK